MTAGQFSHIPYAPIGQQNTKLQFCVPLATNNTQSTSGVATSQSFPLNNGNDGLELRVKLVDDTVWLSQQQISKLFDSSRTNVVEHIKHVYEEGELDKQSTCRNFRQVQLEGNREVSRELPYYSLDMILSVGYRVKSKPTNYGMAKNENRTNTH